MSNTQENRKETYSIDSKHKVKIPSFEQFNETKNIVICQICDKYYIYDADHFKQQLLVAWDKLAEAKGEDKNLIRGIIRVFCGSVITEVSCDENNKFYLGYKFSGSVEYEEVIPKQRVLVRFKEKNKNK